MMQRDAIKPSRAGQNRGWRREHHIKTRRLKDDWITHYNDLDCRCRIDPRVQARFADYPQDCSCYGCGNRRRVGKGKQRLNLQERRKQLGS